MKSVLFAFAQNARFSCWAAFAQGVTPHRNTSLTHIYLFLFMYKFSIGLWRSYSLVSVRVSMLICGEQWATSSQISQQSSTFLLSFIKFKTLRWWVLTWMRGNPSFLTNNLTTFFLVKHWSVGIVSTRWCIRPVLSAFIFRLVVCLIIIPALDLKIRAFPFLSGFFPY